MGNLFEKLLKIHIIITVLNQITQSQSYIFKRFLCLKPSESEMFSVAVESQCCFWA